MKTACRGQSPRRDGFVLIIILVFLVLLTLGGYAFTHMMVVESESSALSGRKRKTVAAANSGVDAVRMFLACEPLLQLEAGGCWDNYDSFCNVPVVVDEEHPEAQFLFSIVAPAVDETGQYSGMRYGLQNESARLNLHLVLAAEEKQPGAGRTMLLNLPGMTEDIAEAILDWIDADDEPRDAGAEADYYLSLPSPYLPANAVPETIDELMQVRDVTPALMFGLDTNRNGRIEQSEEARFELLNMGGVDDPTDYGGDLDFGWYGCLTLWSAEKNLSCTGEKRIDLNNDDLEELTEELGGIFSEEQVAFIIAYRQKGAWEPPPVSVPSPEEGEDVSTEEPVEEEEPELEFFDIAEYEVDLERAAKVTLESPLDLIGVMIQADEEPENAEATAVYASPFSVESGDMADYLPMLLDFCTTREEKLFAGRININEAPRPVLMCLPGLMEEQVDEILAQRPADPSTIENEAFAHPGWILCEGIVTLEEFVTIYPLITTGGNVFRVESVGFQGRDGQVTRVEAILDATHIVPKTILQRDISQLGRGYSRAQLSGEELMEE